MAFDEDFGRTKMLEWQIVASFPTGSRWLTWSSNIGHSADHLIVENVQIRFLFVLVSLHVVITGQV